MPRIMGGRGGAESPAQAAWLQGLCSLSRLWAQLRGEGAGGPSKAAMGAVGAPKQKGRPSWGLTLSSPMEPKPLWKEVIWGVTPSHFPGWGRAPCRGQGGLGALGGGYGMGI